MIVCDHHEMMTEKLGFSILSAPLAAIDRRELSQAWYSSLHIERERAASPGSGVFPRTQSCMRVKAENLRVASGEVRSTAVPVRQFVKQSALDSANVPERRIGRSPIARKIERAFLDPRKPVRRTTLLLGSPRARIHVTIQQDKSGTRLVAICPESVGRAVARALDEVRYALAARGTSLSTVVRKR